MKATVTTTTARPTLPLSLLIPSERNVRKGSTDVSTLAASILSVGVIQNLVVIPSEAKPGHFEVIAGERRLAALSALLGQGQIESDFAVPVDVREAKDATEVSLAENTEREDMHPADEFDAFVRLTAEGKTIDQIADKFGVTPLVVERRLRLAAAAPELIEEFRADELTTDQLIALCASDDHERQLTVWNNSKGRHWMCEPKALRKAVLGDGEIDVSRDSRIGFIGGLDVYRAAGGEVRRDLLTGDGNGGFITDAALLDSLVADKLEEAAAQVRAEGWGWVELWPEFDHSAFHRLGRAPKSPGELPADDAAKIEALTNENAKLDAEQDAIQQKPGEYSEEDSERLDVIWERMEEIRDEIDELTDAHAVYTPDVLARAGAVVALESGKLRIDRGMVKASDRKAVQAAAGEGSAVSGGRETEPAGRKSDALSDALRRSLLGHRNLAAQIATAERPDVAKVLLACSMVEHIRSSFGNGYRGGGTPCDYVIGRDGHGGTRTYHPITDEAGEAKTDAFRDACKAMVKKLPEAEGKLWDALAAMKSAELDKIIAVGVALSVSLSTDNNGLTGKLLAALDFDMAANFVPTAENYLGRVSKPLVIEALAEAGKVKDEADKTALLAMKKGVLASEAESRLADTGWTPAVIRSPKPKKPAAPKPKAAKKATAKKATAKKAKG